jgi:hypothetical protein
MGDTDDQEVESPLKQKADPKQAGMASEVRDKAGASASKQQFEKEDEMMRSGQRKRKSKGTGPATQTPDLNIPVGESNAIVPVGLVNSRVNQMDGAAENSGGSMIETLKKQKRGTTNQNAISAGAAGSGPRRAQ